jgi:hypothetical protein
MVSEKVKLIRNNSVPMLQVQFHILDNSKPANAEHAVASSLCALGLNDVLYVVPEFEIEEYDSIYQKICTGREFEGYKPFFDHYQGHDANAILNNCAGMQMGYLMRSCMTAIEPDSEEPETRGKAFINLKHIPNGHYSILYLRIGQPISLHSQFKILGRASSVYVNFDRESISRCQKPQFDICSSPVAVHEDERSRFKILRAQQSLKRDNRLVYLNSDRNDQEETPKALTEDQIELQNQNKSSKQNRLDDYIAQIMGTSGRSEDQRDEERPTLLASYDAMLERMSATEDQDSYPTTDGFKISDLVRRQESKEYFNKTQRKDDSLIESNPEFQIFSIDEEDTWRTSQKSLTMSVRPSPPDDQVVPAQRQKMRDYHESEYLDVPRPRQDPIDEHVPDPDEEDESYLNTPNLGTPPDDAPEDAFRNTHRYSQRKRTGGPAIDFSVDTVGDG